MHHNHVRSFALRCAAAFALTLLAFTATFAQTDAELGAATEKILNAAKAGHLESVLPELKMLSGAISDNAQIHLLYGTGLLSRSKQISDVGEAQKLSADALKEFLQAKKLGLDDPALDELIQRLGGPAATPRTPVKLTEAQVLMDKAETFFTQSKYDEALPFYLKALEKDPKLYEAALYAGDVYV